MYNTLIEDANKSIAQISDPYTRVMAIAAILPFVSNEVPAAKPVETSKTAEAKATAVEATEAVVEQAKPAEPPKDEAVAAAEEPAIVIPQPKENETAAETLHRVSNFIKVHGKEKLSEVFSNEETMQLIQPEIVKIGGFQQKLHSVLDRLASADQVEDLFHHYVRESDPTADDYLKVTMDRLLNVYLPYQDRLDAIYDNDLAIVDKAIRTLYANLIPKEEQNIQIGAINIDNAQTLLDVIAAVKKAA